jgi:Protein of unknown function (DUF433)
MTIAARVIHSDPDILGGTPVFVGTRVPMKTLLDYLEAGDPLDEFGVAEQRGELPSSLYYATPAFFQNYLYALKIVKVN